MSTIAPGINPELLARQASDTRDVVRFKQEMDGLKERLGTNGEDKEKALRKACQNFEAVFISKLWKEMKSTVPKEGYLHSKQEDMYMSMFDRQFSEKMSEAGGIGLADMIYDQLSQKLKETSRTALSGGVQLNPLHAQPIAMGGPQEAIPLAKENKGMTLEDWGGNAADVAPAEAPVTSEEIVSRLSDDRAVPRPAPAPANDIEVKAQLEALVRRLEAERIKEGLLGSASGERKGLNPSGQLGRNIAEIG